MIKKIIAVFMAIAVLATSGILPQSTVNVLAAKNDSKYEKALSDTNPIIVFAGLLADNQAPWRLRDEYIGLGDVGDVFRLSKLMEDPLYRASDAVWAMNNQNLSDMTDYYVAGLIDVMKNQVLTEKNLEKTYKTHDYFTSDTWLEIMEKNPWKGDVDSERVDSAIEAHQKATEWITKSVAWLELYGDEKEWKKLYKILADDEDMEDALEEMGYDTYEEIMTYVSNGKEFIDLLCKISQAQAVSDEAVRVLKDMKSNTGNFGLSATDRMAFNYALDIMIGACDVDFTSAETASYLMNVVSADLTEVAVGEMLDQLADVNPQYKVAKKVLEGTYKAADLLFDASDMYELTRISKAQTDIFRVLQKGMLEAERRVAYGEYQSASLYVKYMEMLNASYELILDNYEKYISIKVPKNKFLMYGKNLVSRMFTPKGKIYTCFGDEKTLKEVKKSLNVIRNECYNQMAAYYSRALNVCTANQKKERKKVTQQESGSSSDGKIEYFWTVPTVKPYTDAQLKKTETKISNNLSKSTSIVYNSYGTTTLNKDVTSNVDVYLKRGVLDLNGHTLTVGGNFYHTGGHLYVNNGKLIVKGSYYFERANGTDENNVTQYTSAPGTIKMLKDKDSITIGKDFVFNTSSTCSTSKPQEVKDLRPDNDYRSAFYKGILKVGGNISFDQSIYEYETCEFRLTGGHPHTITARTASSIDVLPNLTFQKTGNKSEEKNDNVLYWSGEMIDMRLTDDVTIYLKDRLKLGKKEYGDLKFLSGEMDLNGHTMTLKGNVFCRSGSFIFNKGTLHVTGDLDCRNYYHLDDDGNPQFVDSSVLLYMIYDKDLLDVDGNLIWSSGYRFTANQNVRDWNVMKAGKVKIGGNFTHEYGNFYPTGSNVVEMDGKGKKLIAVKGKINILKLNQPMSMYTINPDDCYVSLYQEYDIKFDGNGAKSGKMGKMTNCAYDQTYKLKKNQFKRPGYVFTGWNTKANGTGKTYKNMATVKNLTKKNHTTVTLYAQWKKK